MISLFARGAVGGAMLVLCATAHAAGVKIMAVNAVKEAVIELGPLPAEIQNITIYAAALHAGSASPNAAQALIAFLTTPQAAASIRKIGLDPPR